jgi:hypothetical protein
MPGQNSVKNMDEHRYLIKAMQNLTFGDSGRFCDLLWLGFGDQWRQVLADLVSHQLVVVKEVDGVEHSEITPRGRSWTQQAGVLAVTAA